MICINGRGFAAYLVDRIKISTPPQQSQRISSSAIQMWLKGRLDRNGVHARADPVPCVGPGPTGTGTGPA